MIGIKTPYTKFTPFITGAMEHIVMTPNHVFGLLKTDYLDKNYIHSCYGSIKYTEDFDALPLVVRMWLKLSKWNQMIKLAHAMDCDDEEDQILYSDFIETDDESMLTSPLIITNGNIAICLAPRVITFDEFEVKQYTDISDVIGNPGYPWDNKPLADSLAKTGEKE